MSVPTVSDQAVVPPVRQAGQGPAFGHALSWAYVMTGGRMAMNLAVSLLLARLLGPEAFGLIAMATVYVFLMEMLVRQGLVAAIIQRPVLTRDHLDSAFWMIMAVVAVVIPVAIGLSPLWARVNATPGLQPVIIGLSPVLVLKGLEAVQEAQLSRKLAYRSLALRTNVAVLVGGIAGIVAAILGAGVWALVIQQVALAAVQTMVLWRVSAWRPRRHFDRRAARDLLGFSGLSGLASIGAFLNTRMDAIVIGLFFGPVAVGLFRLAMRLVETVTQALSGAVQNVSLPEFSRHASNRTAFDRRVVDVVHLSNVTTVPFLAMLAVVADPLLGLLGKDWEAAAGVLTLLCVAGAVQVSASLVGPMLQAAGRPGMVAWVTWLAAGFSAVGFVVGGLLVGDLSVDAQVQGLAMARLAAHGLIILVLVWLIPRTTQLRWWTAVRTIARPGAASLLGYALARAALATIAMNPASGGYEAFAVAAIVGVVCVAGCVLTFEPLARRLVTSGWGRVVGLGRRVAARGR